MCAQTEQTPATIKVADPQFAIPLLTQSAAQQNPQLIPPISEPYLWSKHQFYPSTNFTV
jgi:hypothetical protein